VHTVPVPAVTQSLLVLQLTQTPVVELQNGVPFAAVHMLGLLTQEATQAPCGKLVVSHILPVPQSAFFVQPQKPAALQTGASPPQFVFAVQWHLLSAAQVNPVGQLSLVSQVPQEFALQPGAS
jgi:hypothetical protein